VTVNCKRFQVSWLCQEVVTRGGFVIPITETGRVVKPSNPSGHAMVTRWSRGGHAAPIEQVGHTLKQLSSLVHFPEKGKTLEPLFRPRERALLQLGALRNRSAIS